MRNIRTIIVDSRLHHVQALSHELKEHCPDIEIIGSSQSVLEAFKQINDKKPDLVFLEIELGTHTSFELLELFKPVFFKFIFVTANPSFAIKAFKYQAVDYILKPFSSLDVISTLELVRKNRRHQWQDLCLKEQVLFPSIIPKLAVNTNQKVELVAVADIVYFEADKNYTQLYTQQAKYVISKNIKELEMLLENQGFYRPHKSFLIHINHIKHFTTKDSGFITMSNDTTIPISQRKKQPFVEMMTKLYRR